MGKKRVLFCCLLMLMGISMAWADETYTGVLVTTPDGETTYALKEMPRICYATDNATGTVSARLYIADSNLPVVTVELKNGRTLKVQWGTYDPSGVNTVTTDKFTTYRKDGRKLFTGGRLIIIGKDGRQYDSAGREL